MQSNAACVSQLIVSTKNYINNIKCLNTVSKCLGAQGWSNPGQDQLGSFQ